MNIKSEIESCEMEARAIRNVLDVAPAGFIVGEDFLEKLENQADLLEMRGQALRGIAGDIGDDL